MQFFIFFRGARIAANYLVVVLFRVGESSPAAVELVAFVPCIDLDEVERHRTDHLAREAEPVIVVDAYSNRSLVQCLPREILVVEH